MPTSEAINPHTVDFLLSDRAAHASSRLMRSEKSEDDLLKQLACLRQRFAPEEAGALLALVRLRRRAQSKFPEADKLFFTGEALEQATAWPVAQHRAEWIDRFAPPGTVLDLGCGIGGDTLALAKYRYVVAYDTDPVRLRLAQANANVLGLSGRVEFRMADWTAELVAERLPPAAAAFADPGRRIEGRRVFSLHHVQPSLAWILHLQRQVERLGVKIMPGVDNREIPDPCGVEFVSHEGVCKEAVLWFGSLAQNKRWASVHTVQGWLALHAGGHPPPTGPVQAGMILHEPDPAVIRAGAFAELCVDLGAHLFDSQIAYLVSASHATSPFTKAFLIEEIHTFALKRLNQRLQALEISQVELKKRGVPFEPEHLRARLTLAKQGRSAVVIFTRRGNQRLMILGRRIVAQNIE